MDSIPAFLSAALGRWCSSELVGTHGLTFTNVGLAAFSPATFATPNTRIALARVRLIGRLDGMTVLGFTGDARRARRRRHRTGAAAYQPHKHPAPTLRAIFPISPCLPAAPHTWFRMRANYYRRTHSATHSFGTFYLALQPGRNSPFFSRDKTQALPPLFFLGGGWAGFAYRIHCVSTLPVSI